MTLYRTYNYSDAEKELLYKLLQDEDLKNISKYTIKTLFNRGVRTKRDILYNLYANLKHQHKIPMKDSNNFKVRLSNALVNNELITILGDYDTDGSMATILTYLALKRLGFKVKYDMNNSAVEGYGLKIESVDNIIDKYPDTKIILTVDNGIRSFEAVEYCNRLNIDVLITDHHNPSAEGLPNATAVVDPKREDCLYPFKGLCGAGVVWKLMLELCEFLNNKDDLDYIEELVWLAGIATVADQVPLLEENRIIVKETLKKFNNSSWRENNYFIKEFYELLGIGNFKTDTIAFYIAPMINSMRRLSGDTLTLVDTLVENDKDEVKALVKLLDKLNKERRELTKEQLDIAYGLLEDYNTDNNVIVISSEKFTDGIVGLVAGKLVEEFNKPVIVLHEYDNGVCKGSCRSITGINIEKILSKLDNYLVEFGGHDMAAGLTITKDKLDLFKNDLISICNSLDDNLFKDVVLIDLVLSENNVTVELADIIENMEPYGNSFTKPLFYLQDFKIDYKKSVSNKADSIYVGSDGGTLRLVSEGGLVSVGFKSVDKFKSLENPSIVSLVGYPSINEFNGKRYAQFRIEKDYILKRK